MKCPLLDQPDVTRCVMLAERCGFTSDTEDYYSSGFTLQQFSINKEQHRDTAGLRQAAGSFTPNQRRGR